MGEPMEEELPLLTMNCSLGIKELIGDPMEEELNSGVNRRCSHSN